MLLPLASQAIAGEQVPLRGVLEGSFTSTPNPATMTALVVATGTGVATQLGRFEFDFPLVVSGATQTGEGTHTFVAANGDVLVADVVAESGVLPSGLRRVLEIATIDPARCSGRFAGATGGYVSERFLNRDTGEVFGQFEGTISSPGAAQP